MLDNVSYIPYEKVDRFHKISYYIDLSLGLIYYEHPSSIGV